MRQISPATNLILAALAALGLLGTLGLPWYAPPLADANGYDGPVERTAFSVSTVFRHHDGAITGVDALGKTQNLLLVLVAAIVVLCALTLVPALRRHVRDVLRAFALALPLIVFVLLVDRPGTADIDVHWGVVAALGLALFTASAAWHGSAMRVRRAPAGSWERRPAAGRR
jgi:hypothetical protein